MSIRDWFRRKPSLKVKRLCDGYAVYWPNKPVGESLQGWYKTKTQAKKVAHEKA